MNPVQRPSTPAATPLHVPEERRAPEGRYGQALAITLIPLGIALNLTIGTVVSTLKFPMYLDAIGTIVVTILAGLRSGLVTGVGSNLARGLIANPVEPWFCGTQAAIACYSYWLARLGGFSTVPRTMLTGVGLGIVSGTISAPVIAYLFGGITGSGTSLITAYFLSAGTTLIQSVILSGLASEPLDKGLQCLLAAWLIRGIPSSLRAQCPSAILARNRL